MTVAQARPPDHARVLVRVAPWTDDWHPATAHHKPDGLRWHFDKAGWMDAHPGDEWVLSAIPELAPTDDKSAANPTRG